MVNKWAPDIFLPLVFFIDMHWLSKALPENLKIVLKHVTEYVNFIKAQACLFKVLCKDKI